MGDGVSRLLKFLEAEERRGFLWNLIDPPVDLLKFLPLRRVRNSLQPEPRGTGVVTNRDQ